MKRQACSDTTSPQDNSKKIKLSTQQETIISNNSLQQIPSELLCSIFNFNDGCEVIKMRRVSKEFKQVIDQELQWKEVVKVRLGFQPIPPPSLVVKEDENSFWREFYLNKIARGKYAYKMDEYSTKEDGRKEKKEKKDKKPELKVFYFVESLTEEYCKQLHPAFKYSLDGIEKDEYYEDKETETNPEKIYWGNIFEDQKLGYSVNNSDDLIAIGESKVGGFPDLPKGMKWPKIGQDGTNFMFGAQINLDHLAYYDETKSIVPQEGGMLYFFCPGCASGCGSYCNPKKNGSQPVIYVTRKQIEKMGGLERRTNEGSTYCHAAKLLFHNMLNYDSRYDTQMVFGGEDFDADIDVYEDEGDEEEGENTEQDVDYQRQDYIFIILASEYMLVSNDGYMWEWGVPRALKGQHVFTGCAVCSGDP